ncbi:hypothetical protein [Pseudoalteromonas rubra]|uniref:Uncharacterized protein n=1 Tax=Pseudoalteromonas rubra TaxID=43658 RepID=A0A0F4Q997_9GAMM|nr:hypothetical protein [Pseudoalteromonas rubra]KJZ04218.1 hypothetical protein TW77_23630 [Pseudoalteromonas rubra]
MYIVKLLFKTATLDQEKFPKFIRVNPGDITLKFVFDNIRNVGIAAALFYCGALIFRGEPLRVFFDLAYSQVFVSLAICLLSFVLWSLNLLQAAFAIIGQKERPIVFIGIVLFLLQAAMGIVFFTHIDAFFDG